MAWQILSSVNSSTRMGGTFHWQGGTHSAHTHTHARTYHHHSVNSIRRPKYSPSTPIPATSPGSPQISPIHTHSSQFYGQQNTNGYYYTHTHTERETENWLTYLRKNISGVVWDECAAIWLFYVFLYYIVILMSFYKNWLIDWCKMLNGTFIIHIGTQWL